LYQKLQLRNQAWWYTPVIPACRRWRQEDCKFKISLGYTASLCLKKPKGKMEGGRKEGGKERRKEGERQKERRN
jgi:hypothetical protein